jgi:hypothetical protein
MKKFPSDILKARHAILSGEAHNACLEILLAPFYWNSTLADTSIRLDGIDLPSIQLSALADKTFRFPINPEEGAIDGSLFLGNAHHPVDVSSIDFIRSRHDGLKVLIKGVYVFEFEGLEDYGNLEFTIAVPVSSCAA